MLLLLIRHALAEDPTAFARLGGADAERPLTDNGRKRMRKVANRLRSQVSGIDLLAASPLRRAWETAEIVARAFGDIPIMEQSELAPESPFEGLLDWLGKPPTENTLALVGHAPQLNELAGLLLTGAPRPVIDLTKSGVALLEFADSVAPGGGVLHWLLTSAQLRSLKD